MADLQITVHHQRKLRQEVKAEPGAGTEVETAEPAASWLSLWLPWHARLMHSSICLGMTPPMVGWGFLHQ